MNSFGATQPFPIRERGEAKNMISFNSAFPGKGLGKAERACFQPFPLSPYGGLRKLRPSEAQPSILFN